MKSCTSCHRLFGDDGGFCPIDGQRLVETASATPPTDPEDKRVGATFCDGRYQIWRTVADGGMGRVYQALDNTAQRSVAMKILHPDVATDPVSVERFKREFEVSATLPHDHIVEVLGFEKTEDGSYALVMEYLEGEELRMLLKREKTLAPERVIRMLCQLALGLAGAHERKQVHRDLKPDNVFVAHSAEGDISKILDFGSVRDNSEGAKKLTVLGTTIGSPYYMAPEQAQGLPSLDHRADVWSAAAIAYECLTGTVPFAGSTGPAILLAILTHDPKPPSEAGKNQSVPETLDEVMERALAKNPDLRYSSIGELADEVGKAYGLTGSFREWAKTPQSQIAEMIAVGLPKRIEEKRAKIGAPLDLGAMDAAFQAGSVGGPTNLAKGAYDDIEPAGVPKAKPWLIPTILGLVGVAVVVIVIVVVKM
ncbi:MAG: serine/threonine-protein kinase [Polyangiaceae bacterium]